MKYADGYSTFRTTNSPSLEWATEVATTILEDLMQFRRMAESHASCTSSVCSLCLSPHLPKIITAITNWEPITFVLPAFPGKSPNLAKVLGPLPDMAERRSLEFLGHLCERIKRFYSPGARVILCSDGRVFSDAVGMRDEDVSAYQNEISKMIDELSLTSVSLFNLDDLFSGLSFTQMRLELMNQYGKSLDQLKTMIRQGSKDSAHREDEDAHRLYCGITRFLYEDAMFPGQTKTRSAIQKECRLRAYEVIQRSNAWSELIEKNFPDAVRLSIHPQACGSKKLGIRLMEAENWMTPWHGVALDMGGSFDLVKRSQAEAMGATLIHLAGRPSHYRLIQNAEAGYHDV